MLLPMLPTDSVFLSAETGRPRCTSAACSCSSRRPTSPAPTSCSRQLIADDDVAPLFAEAGPALDRHRRPMGLGAATTSSTSNTTSGTTRCPSRAGCWNLLALCSRLHGTLLDRKRPLWEFHLIEGLADGRFAIYFKMHHALVDGVAAQRLLQNILTQDPDARDLPAPWADPARADQRRPANCEGRRAGAAWPTLPGRCAAL